jgi:hypothetical protein
MDAGVTHNHFDNDERGCWWIFDDLDEEIYLVDFESRFVISISDSII